jgi:7-carboxy-7-deazaguanine synthase
MSKPKLPIIELFTSIQGEGLYAGMPSVFVRVTGCNLRCIFKDSICDTPYSSFNPEKPKFTVEDVVKEFINHPKVNHLVITGGEPTLYDLDGFLEELYHILDKEMGYAYAYNIEVTIETNGTNEISKRLLNDLGLISVSPKLSTSCVSEDIIKKLEEIPESEAGHRPDFMIPLGNKRFQEVTVEQLRNHNKNRINIDVLTDFAEAFADVQYKFVYSGPESEKEILEIRENIVNELFHRNPQQLNDIREFVNDCIWLMPEGIDSEKLSETAKEAVEVCIRNGWHYTDRLHIRIWGNERNK